MTNSIPDSLGLGDINPLWVPLLEARYILILHMSDNKPSLSLDIPSVLIEIIIMVCSVKARFDKTISRENVVEK